MKRLVICIISFFLFYGYMPASADEGVHITHGPVLGLGANAKKMKIWIRTSRATAVHIEYSDRNAFRHMMSGRNARKKAWKHSLLSGVYLTREWKDYTQIIMLDNLDPATRYYYRIWLDGIPQPGLYEFITPPLWSEEATFSFAVLSDFSRGRAPVYATVDGFDPDFVILLGDLDHRAPATLRIMRQMHRDHRGDAPAGQDYKRHLMKHPLFHVWDDHDFGGHDSDKNFPGKHYAIRAFREYFMVPAYQSQNGIWHSFRYAQAEFFMLDLRSQRYPSGMPDGPDKSMLGAEQKAWLKEQLLHSKARWKFLMSTVSFNRGAKPLVSWAAYPTEAQEIIDFIRDNAISGVIIISGDMHSGGAIDDGTNSDFPELSVPHANMNPSRCITGGQTGEWSEEFICGIGNPGFGFITVTPEEVLLEIVGADGDIRTFIIVQE